MVLWACSDATSPPRATPLALAHASAGPDDYVNTPAGRTLRSCVHEIESGARVEKHNVVRRADGTTYTLPACNNKASTQSHFGMRARGAIGPQTNGWVETAWDYASTGGWFSQLSAYWKVPAVPVQDPYASGGTYFAFPGLESDSFIVQPVTQFGAAADGGEDYWSIASWHCDTEPLCTYSTPAIVLEGDVIHGTVVASNCASGSCLWTITTTDVTSNQTSVLPVTDTDAYAAAVGGTVEVYGMTSCNEYPVNGPRFYNVTLTDQNGANVSPTWYPTVYGGTPSCSFNVTDSVSQSGGVYSSIINDEENPVAVTTNGYFTAECSDTPCTPYMSRVSASGGSITMTGTKGPNDPTGTGTITMTGATASGSFSASCGEKIGCLRSIIYVYASGNTITLMDADKHTGTITLSGATVTGGLTASCTPLPCTPTIIGFNASGSNVITIYDNDHHTGTLTLQ